MQDHFYYMSATGYQSFKLLTRQFLTNSARVVQVLHTCPLKEKVRRVEMHMKSEVCVYWNLCLVAKEWPKESCLTLASLHNCW